MIKRTISTIVLWTVVIALLFVFKAPAGAILIVLLAAATQHELYGLLERCELRPLKNVGIVLGILYLASEFLLPQFKATVFLYNNIDGLSLCLVIIALFALIPRIPNRAATLAATVFGFIYVPYLFHYFFRILDHKEVYDQTSGLFLVFWVVVLVKFTDIGAYVVGSLIGKHKMAPKISPGKTWEGFAGGLIVSASISAGYVALFHNHLPVTINPFTAAFLAVPIAVVSVASDLIESVFKRQANVKDSGRTIPGIGGAFDLTDSLILSVPVAYTLLVVFI